MLLICKDCLLGNHLNKYKTGYKLSMCLATGLMFGLMLFKVQSNLEPNLKLQTVKEFEFASGYFFF